MCSSFMMGVDVEAMSNEALPKYAHDMKLPTTRKRKERQEIYRHHQDKRTAFVEVGSRTDDISKQYAVTKTDTISFPCSVTTSPDNMQFQNENRTSTATDVNTKLHVGALSIPELMKHAFALGVPTRKKSSNGHRYRRALRDVRADCVARQLHGPIRPEQHSCVSEEIIKKQALASRCGYNRVDEESANVYTSLSEDVSGPVIQDLSPVVDSSYKSIDAEVFRDHNSSNSGEQALDRQGGTNEQTGVRHKDVSVRRGPRPDVMQRAVALGIETRRGSPAEVMHLAVEFGIETHRRDEKNKKRWRSAKEVWKDLICLQKSYHVAGTRSADHMTSPQLVLNPGIVDRRRVLPEQPLCVGKETRQKQASFVRCGMNQKAVRRWAMSLGVETRKRDKNGIKNRWRGVQDMWSDCIRLKHPCLPDNLQSVAVSDSACQWLFRD